MMSSLHHINCGFLHVPPNPKVTCHCLLIEDRRGLALIDTGIGMLDIKNPEERIGREAIAAAGFQFEEKETAVRQLQSLGFQPERLRHIVLTHADPDHAGGLADFSQAQVHLSREERLNLDSGNPRYSAAQFRHGPLWRAYGPSRRRWFGLEARELDLGLSCEVLLIPLFGHTLGHCGVAVQQEDRWVLHVGDAYYLRIELETDDHPVSRLASLRADDDLTRRESLDQLRRLVRDHQGEVELFGYHDIDELMPVAAR
jgi:glyoxylase-like metal-dependent hydrolase (beta-lactamase superfamily II)